MKLGLIPKLLIGIAVGILLGFYAPMGLIKTIATLGYILGQYIKFIIPLIVIAFVGAGIAGFGQQAGRILTTTIILAYVSTILAESLSFSVGWLAMPWLQIPMGALTKGIQIAPYLKIDAPPVMGVMSAIVLAIILGMGATWLQRKSFLDLLEDFREIIFRLLRVALIPVLPYFIATVFCELTAKGQLLPTATAFAKVLFIIIPLQWAWLLVLFCVAGIYNRRNPFPVLRTMLPAYFTACGTMSSAATLPVALDCARKVSWLRREVVDFCIPMCNIAHLPGSAMTITMSAMVVMMLTQNQTPSFSTFLPFIILLGLIEVAAPGVPGGSVTAALGILQSSLGFNDAGLALMIAIFMIQDSFGTATNVTGDAAITMIVDKALPVVATGRKSGGSTDAA
jgi:Na+/H+-dicarboxylate symporter